MTTYMKIGTENRIKNNVRVWRANAPHTNIAFIYTPVPNMNKLSKETEALP